MMMSNALAQAPLVVIPQYFGSLVFDRSTSRYLPFDHETTDLLLALKRTSIDEILAHVPDGSATSIMRFYHCFCQRGFFGPDGYFLGSRLDVVPPSNHLTGPLATHLEIIAACNLACSHCFAGALPRNQRPLKVPEMADLFDQLAAMGAFRLGLTGGEPTLRKDLIDILDAATERGLHPCLTTNGLTLTPDLARALGKRDLVWLNVSLDGATAETNDAVRGPGTFDRVVANLRMLRQHARFTLAFTLMSHNIEEVEACARLAHDVGAHTAVFRPLYPVGVAQHHPELMPSYEDYAHALECLEGMVLPNNHDVCGLDPFSPQRRAQTHARVVRHGGCGAGTHVCSISVQGDVNPCSFMGARFESGNIRERSFRDIWNHGQRFVEMRTPAQPGGFAGGCRARAQAASGSVHDADPWHDAWQTRQRRHPKDNMYLEAREPNP